MVRFILLLLLPITCFGQQIKGTITSQEKPVGYATVLLKNTKWGTTTDISGNFILQDIMPGIYQIKVSAIGFRGYEQSINLDANTTLELDIELEEMPSSLNEVVISGTRTSRRKLESPVAVNILDSKTLSLTQSTTLSEGLCFQAGLRVETDCQTCNYTQLRMNGLGGSYSQILINSRPVFTSLLSLYGLEQIPANMIERVEVVRGGGSVLYGSSAIAGTVNIITKEPETSGYTIATNSALIDGQAWDHSLNANINAVNPDASAGVSFFASHRDKEAYDANGDGFSELTQLKNNSFGFNSYFHLTEQDKLQVNGWSIYENRRGGNQLTLQADKADQAEYRLHNILIGGLDYTHTSKDNSFSYSLYGAAQHTTRTHYTGIDGADGWGNSLNKAVQAGVQLNYTPTDFILGSNTFTTGVEHLYESTFDEIPAYNYLIDQETNLTGAFLQSDWELTQALTLLSGVRLNQHNKMAKPVLTPRISMLYKAGTTTQFRASFAKGFKAPQAFEADMHIAFAGGGISFIQIDPDLKAETSQSMNLSVDYNKASEQMIYGFTADLFHTRLHHAFVLEEIGTDANGNQQLFRKNGGNSTVKGITLEGRINYDKKAQLETGITLQSAQYEQAIAWSESVPGTKAYLRNPEMYGYYVLSLFPEKRFTAALSGVLTGPMLVPHFAGAEGITEDQLYTSPTFLENNLKLAYKVNLKSIQQDIQLHAGVQNIFNAYQQDFDRGRYRDSNYVYGPARPRTVFFGITFGNF